MDAGENEQEESSSQRRERLLALRSAANASPAEAPGPPPAGSLLPDPDLAGDQASSLRPRPPQRFDFYTNPAAAFSSSYSGGATNPTWSHKRKSPPAGYDPRPAPPPPPPPPGYAGPGNYGNNYPPHQHHLAPSPIDSPPLMPRDATGSSPWRSPMQFQDPMSGYQGAPPGAPPPWGPHFGPPPRGSYPNSPRFGYRQPNPGQGGSPMNYGPRGSPMNYGPRGSPNSSYGRGRGPSNYGNTGSRGRGGRGGFGFQNQNHGWQGRSSYSNKSMVDDPWLGLEPIVGNILIPRFYSDSWLPKSLREKKETPAQSQIKSASGPSLAEYLDLSFNEVSDKEA